MTIEFKPRTVKDCLRIDKKLARIILLKIEPLSNNLHGDVKKLADFSPEYRLRVGNYRVLFKTEENKIITY
ncbi:MAG: type II toxin-antitoxin system RelE/ParE family toxin [Candidatus Omnitrophica bacterium]|nr:type II toxin-antitoxin system RelE/ParE family toxin [Candidatus Omnitrophota bacterium]